MMQQDPNRIIIINTLRKAVRILKTDYYEYQIFVEEAITNHTPLTCWNGLIEILIKEIANYAQYIMHAHIISS